MMIKGLFDQKFESGLAQTASVLAYKLSVISSVEAGKNLALALISLRMYFRGWLIQFFIYE